ncbi:PTS sugar transporter subunit IIA [Terricaulis silvestris]|jgi:PTS system nitrogen regulatory IIA component|uniref:Nitrogen regulatory protein n=1 Tax=Terricaulis silvestris TaxID=2686094 RepID=A0A6I6MGN9_9CAUL|nr:PTS sugar transporter subunit IIA [Terricaulis silvestris]QGZ93479.1 Nitrogen regulatory protein [Terricaulis silvestris]
MSGLSDLIAPEAILPRLLVTSRRQALQIVAETLAKSAGVDPRAAFDAVLIRERLSGTGMGEGVAIPHGPVPGVTRPVGAFARLEPAQDFEALDGRPADLVFMLFAPPDRGADHLKALARVSRFLRRADMREKLRASRGADDLAALIASAERAPGA